MIATLIVVLFLATSISVLLNGSDYSSATGETSGNCGATLTWNYDGSTGTLSITGSGVMTDYDNDEERWGGNIIRHISFPIGLTHIGNNAFAFCYFLEEISIPNTVTSIGEFGFYNCASLKSVIIPNNVTSIGDCAFEWCTSLNYFLLPDSITSLSSSIIGMCPSLTSVSIPDSVTNIDDSFSFGSGSLTTINVGYNNENYCSENGILFNKDKTKLILYPCGSNATSYVIPNTVTTIGNSAFHGAANLTSITIPNSVTSIGNNAFEGCLSLGAITLPESLVSIDYAAFSMCPIESIIIPDSVLSMDDAFLWCPRLKTIDVGDSNANYSSENGVLFNKDKTTLFTYPIGKTDVSYSIPSTVKTVNSCAFEGCSSLTAIDIPDSVTGIGDCAFRHTSLHTVSISEHVSSMETAFCDINELTSIDVNPSNVRYFSENGVLFNKSKTYLYQYPAGNTRTTYTIPDSVKMMETNAFNGCRYLSEINVGASNLFYSSLDGVLFNKEKTVLIQYPLGNARTSYVIPESVLYLNPLSFYGSHLTEISIGESNTTYIADGHLLFGHSDLSTHYYGGNLTYNITNIIKTKEILNQYLSDKESFTVPSYVKMIDYLAFKDTPMKTIEFTEGTTTIVNGIAFFDSNIEKIIIPNETDVYFQYQSIGFTDNKEHTITVIAPKGYHIPSSALYGNIKLVYVEYSSDQEYVEPEHQQKEVDGKKICVIELHEGKETPVTKLFSTAKSDNASVEIKVGSIDMTFDSAAVADIAGKTVSLKAELKTTDLNIENAQAVIEISLKGSTFENGEVKVTVPFTNTVPDGKEVKVYYIDGDNRKPVDATYENDQVTFTTNHFSTYAIVFEDSSPSDEEKFPIWAIAIIAIVAVITIGSGALLFARQKRNI